MRYRLQRHDGTDCSATMVPFTPLRMVPIQRYCQGTLRKTSILRMLQLSGLKLSMRYAPTWKRKKHIRKRLHKSKVIIAED